MMNRVVITGMGIYSCLGKTLDEVRESLYNGKSGIIFAPERKEMGFRSALTAKLEEPDLKKMLSRSHRVYSSNLDRCLHYEAHPPLHNRHTSLVPAYRHAGNGSTFSLNPVHPT